MNTLGLVNVLNKHDRSLAAVRDAKTAVADKVNEGHQASSVHDNPSH